LGEDCLTCVDDCGCTGNDTCVAGVCVCIPFTCESAGFTCGSFDNGCGATISCGTCVAPKTCINGQCECSVPYTAEATPLCNASFCLDFQADSANPNLGRFIVSKANGSKFTTPDVGLTLVDEATSAVLWETGCNQAGIKWEYTDNLTRIQTQLLDLNTVFNFAGCKNLFAKLNAPCGGSAVYPTPALKICGCL